MYYKCTFQVLCVADLLRHLQKLLVEGSSSHFSFKLISASIPSIHVTAKQKYVVVVSIVGLLYGS